METFAEIAQEDLLPVIGELGETAAPVLATILEELADIVKEQVLPSLEDFGNWLASDEGQQAVDDFTESLSNTAENVAAVSDAISTLMNNPLFQGLIDRLVFIRDNFTVIGWGAALIDWLGGVGEKATDAADGIERVNGRIRETKFAANDTIAALAAYNELLATTVNTGSLAGVLEASAGEGIGGGQVGFDAEEYLKSLGLGASSGEAKRAADKLARSRDQLLERVGNLSKDFARVTGISETPLGEFEQNVNKTFENVTGIIDKALADDVISSRVSGQLQKIAKSARITALGIAREREAIAQDYEKLLNKLDAARAVRESTRDQISALANLKELGTMTREVVNDLGEVEEETTFTVDNIVNNLEKLLTETMDFSKRLEELRQLGLDPRLFQQIVDSGVDAGGQTAQAIIEGGPQAVTEINELFADINEVGEEIGLQTSEVLYDGGEAAIEGLLEGLRSRDAHLAEQSQEVADIMMNALQDGINGKDLNVNAIIRQLKDMRDDFKLLGKSLGDALLEGLEEVLNKTEEQTQAMEDFVSTPVTSYAVPGGGSGVAVPVEGGPGTIGELPQAEQDFLKDWLGSDFGIEAELALGGIVTKPTRALIGEGGQEAVIPLSTYDRMMRNQGQQQATQIFNITVQASNRTGGAQAGEEVVNALKTYNTNNGDFNRALTGIGS